MEPVVWNQRFGGLRWILTEYGVKTEADGWLRTPGEPVTARRLLESWGADLRKVAIVTQVPTALLMMTALTEGALRWTGVDFDYPPVRREPGYISEDMTPHRVSYGPMHVLLSTYRTVMYAPKATGKEAGSRLNNILAAGLYITDSKHRHNFDPILTAAIYNSGGIHDASDAESRYHNRWHLRAHGNHLDRAARWYGDSLQALRENPPEPGPPNIQTIGKPPDRLAA